MEKVTNRLIEAYFAACEAMGEKTPEPGKCLKCGEMTAYTWDTNWGIQTACQCGHESYYSLGD